MIFLIKNINCYEKDSLENGRLFDLYISVVCTCLDLSEKDKSIELIKPCSSELWGNYMKFILFFFDEDVDCYRQKHYRLRKIVNEDYIENRINEHFNSHYPEIKFSMAITGSMLQDQKCRANFKFIMGVILAVTGAALIIAAVATVLMLGASAGLVLSSATGALGMVGLFSGSYFIARGLAEKETLSTNFSASSSAM